MQVLKRFRYSKDGKTPIEAMVGDPIDDIPRDLCEGLFAEGFIGDPLENKANLRGAPETLDVTTATGQTEVKIVDKLPDAEELEIAELRDEYLKATGSEADKRWSAATLREKIIEA